MEKEQNEAGDKENEERVVSCAGSQRIPDSFVEGSLHGVVTRKGDLDGGCSEEGSQDPGELGSHKRIPSDPGDHGHSGDAGVGRGGDEHAGEMDICHHAGEGDERGVGNEKISVRRGRSC